ncbi:polar amino acid transport system substrate-binding protein [Inhella inkyongensis]|uniref:Polar amino acid transport system substrate-binding protein n=1 Tax=Inhella inkyongensis TaxID=392593 RepID=A0A840S5Y3_9BURK|nr:transporter substrate-binding domain-containing protein [Inhella inkyongensis]MBB5205815.1 polar amino acid transport system substrate-binding protein [Inhella inkyongensis]
MRWLILLLTLACLPAHADPRLQGWTVQVCDDANEWPPYTYYERVEGQKTEQVRGFSIELLERLLQPLGLKYRIELLPWVRCLQEVQRGQDYQLLLNATRNPERERAFLITEPTYSTRTYYFWSRRVHPQGLKVRTQADLKRYRIGGVRGYTYSQLDQIDMASLQRGPNYASLVQMLHLDRIDVIVVGEEVFHGLAGLPGYELAQDPDLGRAPLVVERPNRFHMMVSRQHPLGPALHAALQGGLAELNRSGELQRLRDRHLRR